MQTTKTADEVREDFQDLNLQLDINDISLESIAEGFFWTYRVIVPENARETNKKSLIFNLHGGAQNIAQNAHK